MSKEKFQKAKDAFGEFCELVAQLRNPVGGCPWDLEQNHQTLTKYMIEEAYEAATVMKEGDSAKICDELGDVLLQVVLNAQVAADEKNFNIEEVIRCIHDKMYRRHPHVFGTEEERQGREVSQILKRWEEIKSSETEQKEEKPFMEQKGVHKVFPASSQAAKIGKVAKSIKFDWKTPNQVFDVLLCEIQELKDEWQKSHNKNSPELYAELGDVYFSLAQLCRHLDLEPELVAMDGNRKFLKRFYMMEENAKKRGLQISDIPEGGLEELWKEAKTLLR